MKKLLWIGLACLVVFFGCSLINRDFYRATDDYFGDPTKGAVDVVLNGGSIATKTLGPNMKVANYVLHFTNTVLTPNEDFTVTIGAGPTGFLTHIQNGMIPSASPNWQVTVTALNSESPQEVIGAISGVETAAATFGITAGTTTNLPVTVIPIDGDSLGDLRVYVSWPDAAGSNETLTATLTPDPTTGGFQSHFTIDPNNDPPVGTRAAIFDSNDVGTGEQLPVGYYNLILKLEDGSTLLWGYMEAVRIVDDLPTDTLDPIDDEKFALALTASGSVELPITPNMNNPIEIAFSPAITDPPQTLTTGQTQTVIATLTLPSPPSNSHDYEWYLDGTATGVSASDFDTSTISPEYDIVADAFLPGDTGKHNLSLLITGRSTAGGTIETLSSENYPFIIQ